MKKLISPMILLACLLLPSVCPAAMSSTNYRGAGTLVSAGQIPGSRAQSSNFMHSGGAFSSGILLQPTKKVLVKVSGVDAADMAKVLLLPGFFPGVSPTTATYDLYEKPRLSAPRVLYAQNNTVRYILTGWTGDGNIVSGVSGVAIAMYAHVYPDLTSQSDSTSSTITWNYQKQVRVKVTTSGEDAPLRVYDLNGNTTAGSTTISSIAVTDLTTGMKVYGYGIQDGTTIAAVNTVQSSVTLSLAAQETFSAAAGQRLSFANIPTAASADPRECRGSDVSACIGDTGAPVSGINYYDAGTEAVSLTIKQSFTDSELNTITQAIIDPSKSNYQQIISGRKALVFSLLNAPLWVDWRYDTTVVFQIGKPINPLADETLRSVVFQDVNNTVAAAAHGLSNGDPVMFTSINSTTGISRYTKYFVINKTTDAFQVSGANGGTPLELVANGSGSMSSKLDYSQKPEIVILAPAGELPGDTPENAFIWAWDNTDASHQRMKYFPVHPVDSFTIKWPLLNASTTDETGRVVWPADMQKHIATAPANLQPPGAINSLPSISYSENGATAIMGVFNANTAGKSVLRFATPAKLPDLRHGIAFIIAKTEEIYPADLFEYPATIGKKITSLLHNDPEDRPGYLYYDGGIYDGAGPDKAYDRAARSGVIIPVNKSLSSDTTPLVVIWYEKGAGDIGWPTTPMRYKADWPTAPATLAIGTGVPVSPVSRPRAMVYNQPDKTVLGCNPNEEHALITGDTLYALRDDLNTINNISDPYVLLKYFDGNLNEWMMDVYQVARPASFTYAVEAGKPILPPLPASFQIPPASGIKLDSGLEVGGEWYLRDHKGGHWAKAANWKDGDAILDADKSRFVMQWHYYMRPDFYWPWTGALAKQTGDVLPFLNDGKGLNDATVKPIDVTYVTRWPTESPVLSIGSTLTKAKDGLPDFYNFQSASIIYDESVYQGNGPLAKLYAPERYLYAPVVVLPPGIKTESGPGGVLTFPELPFAIQARLFYDPGRKELGFKGTWISAEGEDPWLLPNLMTAAEKDTIKTFSSGVTPAWQTAVDNLYLLARNPNNVSFPVGTSSGQNPFDATEEYDFTKWGIKLGLEPESPDGSAVSAHSVIGEKNALTAGMAQGEGYVVIAENNDPALNEAPVALHVIKIAKSPVFQGTIKAIKSKNVFDEKLTLHYTGDFGGEPENFTFEWYYQPVVGSMPGLPPAGAADVTWQQFITGNPTGTGDTDITIQGASPLTLSDNWFVARYYYKNAWPAVAETSVPAVPATPHEDSRNWSNWSGANRWEPMLATGWIKRVVDGLNPLEARVTDFRTSATNTTVSMISQFGSRYEGDIAMNSGADNLNDLGLISAYETVLNRARAFSIDAQPPQNYGPTNDALLNISSRLATFYLAVGNEAYADAVDPTIGFSTKSAEYGNMAPSVFSFQNQLDSLLAEELTLLRGRDDTSTTTKNAPYYNRLIWNFTQGEGEVAYAQNYNVTDQDSSGVINAGDARIMYPQGHGDAWGHYLQAIKYYYNLLGHSAFSWEPRVEYVLVAGNPIMVDYLDERKFAAIAAARAKIGSEILDLTYKDLYTDDPAGQWQGYKDTYPNRAWGVDEWARRAGQAAFFDWVTANAILPDSIPDVVHNRTRYIQDATTGTLTAETIPGADIQQIDRSKVPELTSIASQFQRIQTKMAEVDSGVNPIGLVKGVVPFDIDPVEISAGKTHFEQVYERAAKALANAVAAYDYANGYTQRLRQNQDTLEQFKKNLTDQERDYKNRLIEIFGYPYADDIGAGKTYPDGYSGPDIFHYNYVDLTELTGKAPSGYTTFTSTINNGNEIEKSWSLGVFTADIHTVSYTISSDDNWQVKPNTWSSKRRAPGKVQQTLSNLLVANANYDRSNQKFEEMVKILESKKKDLEKRYSMIDAEVNLRNTLTNETQSLSLYMYGLQGASEVFKGLSEAVKKKADAAVEAVPKVVGMSNDATSGLRGMIKAAGGAASITFKGLSIGAAAGAQYVDSVIKGKQTGYDLKVETMTTNYELVQQYSEMERMLSDIDQQLLETWALKESVQQALGNYDAALAEGLRLLDERAEKRAQSAAEVQEYRFQDLGFRVFRNDAIQKYRAQFDLAARYVYLAATAYDYETNLLGSASGAGRKFLSEIGRQSALGVISNGMPQAGFPGLADTMARLSQNFAVYKTQLGFNNPQTETTPFSLRTELFRIKSDTASTEAWRDVLKDHRVDDLWKIPEYKRFCRPFAPESAGPQPGIVIKFPSTVTYGKNFFGWPLSGGDSAYSSSNFSTRVRSAGVWFQNYNSAGLSSTPRVYLVPVGADILRSPTGDGFATREWQVRDQVLPVPFPISSTDLQNPSFIPANDSLSDEFAGIRRVSDFRAYPYSGGFNANQTTSDSRLIGRSVWNTQWMMIIPGSSLLFNKEVGLNNFINSVDDIKMFFQTYAYSGN